MRPPECGPQTGEELVHAERLGHVVVGAGVEGRDLVALGLAHREHDDRHLGPAAQSVNHVDPVDPRQSEVEHDDVRMMTGRQLQRLLTGLGQIDLVSARPEVDTERTPDLRLVVAPRARARQSRRSLPASRPGVRSHGQPPAGRVLHGDLAIHPLDESRATARPSPTPVPFGELSPNRWNGSNILRVLGRDSGPRSITRRSHPSPTAAGFDRAPADPAVTTHRVVDHVRDGPFQQGGVGARRAARSSGTSTTTRGRPARLASARRTTSSSPTSRTPAETRRSAGDSCRAGCRRAS